MERALSLAPDNPSVLHHVGAIILVSTDPEVAVRTLEKAIHFDPGSPWSHIWLARALFFSQGKKEEGYRAVKEGISIEPKNAWSYGWLGRMLEEDGDYHGAFLNYCRSVELDPTFPENAREELWSLLRRKEKPGGMAPAIASLVGKLEMFLNGGADDTKLILKTLALALIHAPTGKEPERAIRYARRLVAEHGPEDPDLLSTLAEVQFHAGERREAVLTLEQAARFPGGTMAIERQLEEYRKALLPDLVSCASIDAALETLHRRAIVPAGASWRLFRGTREPPRDWMRPELDDSAWEEGPSGFGYGDDDDATVLSDMKGAYTTVYIRHAFTVPDPAAFQDLFLSVTVDDGFVAYLNGQEVAWYNADTSRGQIPFDATALTPIEPARIRQKLEPKLLHPGKNLLAVQGLNGAVQSTDLSLIPVLETTAPPDVGPARRLLESLLNSLPGDDTGPRRAYLQGEVLELEGNPARAAEMFSQAALLEPDQPEPLLRLAECLRASGDPAAVEKRLRGALETHSRSHRDLWLPWFKILAVDLKMTPEEILRGFPRPSCACGDDLRWALEELTGRAAIRINCAGGEYQSRDGTVWGRDRFFRGGKVSLDGARFTMEIHGTEDGAIYQKHRWFGSDETGSAYRVPVPPGRYRVTLHFAEIGFLRPGARIFEVRVEGGEAWRCEPLRAGFATALKESFTVAVEDGVLDIEFLPRADNPEICGIEIEKG